MDQTTLVEHPTASWEAMNDGAVFYSKKHFYQMQWNLGLGGGGGDLAGYVIAAAKLGGPIGMCSMFEDIVYLHGSAAIMRDNSKLVALGRTTFIKPVIQVYSSAGAQLATINVRPNFVMRVLL